MSDCLLYCPIPSAIHPLYETARTESRDWLMWHQLIRGPQAIERFSRLRVPELVARAHPDAAYEDLRIAMDWTVWTFLADDQHDDLVRKPELLRGLYLEYVEVLENGLAGHVTGMHIALADLCDRIVRRSGPECLRRFASSVREWFDSMHAEVMNRVRATPPSIVQYLRMREITAGMYTRYALLDVTHQVRTADSFWIDPDVRRLLTMAANLIGWANDIFSYEKEREAGDPHNLVLLLGNEQGVTVEEAIERTANMHDREIRRFLELEESVRSKTEVPAALLEPLLHLLRGWIRGNLDWAMSSDRYGLEPTPGLPPEGRLLDPGSFRVLRAAPSATLT